METDGLVKILADPDTDEILGVHMMGARIADLIAEAVVALEYRASAEDLSRMSMPILLLQRQSKKPLLMQPQSVPCIFDVLL